MIAEFTDLLRNPGLCLVEPVADPVLCSECGFVLVAEMHPDNSKDAIDALNGEAIFFVNGDPLCSECRPDDPREDCYRRADMKLDEMKDRGY